MRVVVTGGRYFDDAHRVFSTLDSIHAHRARITALIQGGAAGADEIARTWALLRGVPIITYAADWKRGRRAGPERNATMLADSNPDLVVAFDGGLGTADTVRRATVAGLEILNVGND